MRSLVAVLLLCLSACDAGAQSPSQIAHGEAEWVMFHPDAGWCCNENDCHRRPPNYARETANGWVIPSTGQVFREGERGLFKSIDADIWSCKDGQGKDRCLFVPGSGA